jgi:hypothetical protein
MYSYQYQSGKQNKKEWHRGTKYLLKWSDIEEKNPKHKSHETFPLQIERIQIISGGYI